MATAYAELHCHSGFSFLDGASSPEELAAEAAALGYEALALTDHEGVWGAMEFAQAAVPLGLKPIVGAEVSIRPPKHPAACPPAHVTLLAESAAGWRNLCLLLTEAHAGTRPRPGREPLPLPWLGIPRSAIRGLGLPHRLRPQRDHRRHP